MPTLQALLDAAAEQIIDIRQGDGSQDMPWSIEFLASAAQPLRSKMLYLLPVSELSELRRHAPLPAAVFFVACGDGGAPELPPELSGTATFVFVRDELLPLYSLLNRTIDIQRTRNRIDDIVLMAENAQYAPEQLVFALSQVMHIGVFILNSTYQRTCGAAPGFSDNPYVKELRHTGALSAESVRRLRDGDPSGVLYEVPSGKWSRFILFLVWRAGARIDREYLCRRLAEFVTDYRNRSDPPDIPPFLVDLRLSRILEGKTTDAAEIRSFFGLGSTPVWFSVLVLGAEPGTRWSAEAYLQQAQLLMRAFRSVSITVVQSRICAVVQLPVRTAQDRVFSRSFFREHCFNDGWDMAQLEQGLQQCGVYLCCSPIFQSFRFFPVQYSLISDALDIAIRLDGCRGQRIVEYRDYSAYVSIQYAMERFLQKFEPRAIRSLLHPEFVTLLLHDSKNHADLVDVLYHYYTYGGDVNRTAQSLFVHRNTVYNKLKTIQKILNADLDDPHVRSSYITSLRIFYYCERCLGLDLHDPM